MSDDSTLLQREILCALGMGTETTLLVLEMVSDLEGGPALDEAAVLQVLANMEEAGLVCRQRLRGPGEPELGVGIPEHERGQSEVVWWALTNGGEVELEEERDLI